MSRLLRLSFDLLLVVAATLSAIVLRTDLDLPSPDFVRYTPYLIATALIALAAIGALKLDVGFWRHASLRDILSVIGVAALTAAGSTVFVFGLNRLDGIARTIPILQFVLIIVVLLAPRLVAKCVARNGRPPAPFRLSPGAGAPAQSVLIVGLSALSELYIRSLAEAGDQAVQIAGFIGLKKNQAGRHVGEFQVLGAVEDLPRVLSDLVVHGIVVNRIVLAVPMSGLSASARETLIAVRNEHGLTLDVLAARISGGEPGGDHHLFEGRDLSKTSIGAVPRATAPFALRELETLARSPYWRIKRCIDIVGSLTLMIVLLPVGLVVAALAIVDLGFPLLFWQVRLGVGGAPFRLFKLRTMAAAYDQNGVRLPDSERVSLIGTLIRRGRLDELPQLWNVLIGDMSLIGPRPLLPADQPSFESGRLLVRPGITGWAQVCGGRDITANSKAALDAWYIRNASFRLDMQILMATFRMILFGERVDSVKVEKARIELARQGPIGVAPMFQPVPNLVPRSRPPLL